ncbi:MAG: RNA 3'-terminal phosphate cyclase [Candidatus Hodarchaeota archaeon]
MIEIDGSLGEGGGQVLRTSVALSALVMKPVKIIRIRAKRPNPGLRPQHLTGIKAVAALVDAEITGITTGSSEVTFSPKARRSGSFGFNVGTAGSISLVLQALMPVAALAPSDVIIRIRGGTDVKWSPTIDYLQYVTFPLLRKIGYEGGISVNKRGHYPKGGGEVEFKAHPVRRFSPITLVEQGEVIEIGGISHCVKLPLHVAERQKKEATKVLKAAGFEKINIEVNGDSNSRNVLGPGSGITIWATTSTGAVLGADALGERGKPAEKVGSEAAKKLISEIRSKQAVDKHMGDMLIPYMAITDGVSEISVSELTLHLLTNIQITQKILGVEFQIKGKAGESGTIEVEGIKLD